ncbi:hypothetical protein BFW38_12085 [Terasakiispira papahanaumokuakeensis]|uniref:Flagellar assembly protein FliH n=1 Tax=Terasakiispira papahanaumokuakeensis TaxID=197479 RepID=A0A1E2VB07_9GAMM|nr:flagellar assembly protein FliH [Terasakiispira papahanaumokuakeensis]ODC04154.1 hypothetical protein BFW38_12085 [Terasakiispira papahanaumokuakeensis]
MTRQTRIPADDVDAYERWEMPDLTGVRRSISRRLEELEAQREAEVSAEQVTEDDVVPVEMPSDEDIEALKAQAYEDGRQEGLTAGHAEGYEHGRAQGYASGEREGSEAGFQSGYEKGLEQARNEVDQLSARFQSQLDQLLRPLAHVDDDAEQALLELAELIATGVLRRELTIDRSSLTHIVQEALNALPDTSRRLRIHVHPDDKVLVEAACEGRFDDYRIVEDPEVTPGGVHIETQYSLVDCTVERRYRAVVEKLMGEQYPDQPPAAGPLPRRAESDSPLGPGHFSAEAALAELESLRAELAAVLGDDAVLPETHTSSPLSSSSANVSSTDFSPEPVQGPSSEPVQADDGRENLSAEERGETDPLESDGALSAQTESKPSTHRVENHNAESLGPEYRASEVPNSVDRRTEKAGTDQPLYTKGDDVPSEILEAPHAELSPDPVGESLNSDESVAPVDPVETTGVQASPGKREPVRVSLSSSRKHAPRDDSANSSPRNATLNNNDATQEASVGDIETDDSQTSHIAEASAADLVTQAAASVQQSAQNSSHHHDDGDVAFPSGETSSVYEDRYSLEDVDTPVGEGRSESVKPSSHPDDTLSDSEQKGVEAERSTHE